VGIGGIDRLTVEIGDVLRLGRMTLRIGKNIAVLFIITAVLSVLAPEDAKNEEAELAPVRVAAVDELGEIERRIIVLRRVGVGNAFQANDLLGDICLVEVVVAEDAALKISIRLTAEVV